MEPESGVFVDTNILVYARDDSEPEKQPQARAWMEALWRTRTGRQDLGGLDVVDPFSTAPDELL